MSQVRLASGVASELPSEAALGRSRLEALLRVAREGPTGCFLDTRNRNLRPPQQSPSQKTLDGWSHLFYYAEHILISKDRMEK